MRILVLAVLLVARNAPSAPRPHAVFATGDDEYRSEYTMPAIARVLEKRHGFSFSVAYARPTPQTNKNLEGLNALKTADLAVFYLRWRELPEEQVRPILDYVESGKPIVGLRTSTHSFRYPAGHPREPLNDGFGHDVFGQKWIRHHGHQSTTVVKIAAGQETHPILRGVAGTFSAPSWLYVVEPLAEGSTPLLIGRATNPEGGKDYGPQPVAWTRTYKSARVFFTTLGHPDDFRDVSMRRLVINGILWALGKNVPENGANADWVDTFDPPASGVPKTR